MRHNKYDGKNKYEKAINFRTSKEPRTSCGIRFSSSSVNLTKSLAFASLFFIESTKLSKPFATLKHEKSVQCGIYN